MGSFDDDDLLGLFDDDTLPPPAVQKPSPQPTLPVAQDRPATDNGALPPDEKKPEPSRGEERPSPSESLRRETPPYPQRSAPGAGRRPDAGEPTRAYPAPDLTPSRTMPPRASSAAPPKPAARATAAPTTERAALQVRRLRRGRLAIRKIDPWAVLKFSLVFFFCMLLIALFGAAIIFFALKAFGVIDNVEKLLRDLEFDVSITGGGIFRWLFLIGLAWVLIASAVSVFMAFLYNLIADVVGGIELLVTERE